jgi:hypothetical protein
MRADVTAKGVVMIPDSEAEELQLALLARDGVVHMDEGRVLLPFPRCCLCSLERSADVHYKDKPGVYVSHAYTVRRP